MQMRFPSRFVFALALCSCSAFSLHAADDPKFFPVTEYGPDFPQPGSVKGGFIDATGKFVIPLTTDFIPATKSGEACFVEGLQPVILLAQRTSLSPFSTGYIDANGQVVIGPQFISAACFSEGLAMVRGKDGYGFIDHTGKYVIPAQFQQAESFSNGLALVLTKEKRGYIDHTGKFVITFDNPDVSGATFSEGLARTIRQEPSNPIARRFAFIAPSGNRICDFKFEDAADFHDGLACVSDVDGYGFINKTGALAFPARFFVAWSFSEGMARVQMKDGKLAWIDQKGNIAFNDPSLLWAEPFSDGLAEAEIPYTAHHTPSGKLHGFIDHTGKWVIPPIYWEATSFRNGLAFVAGDGFNGYITKSGQFVWKGKLFDLSKVWGSDD
jgi:hypothetical protein